MRRYAVGIVIIFERANIQMPADERREGGRQGGKRRGKQYLVTGWELKGLRSLLWAPRRQVSLEEQQPEGAASHRCKPLYMNTTKKNALEILVITDKVESWRLWTKARCALQKRCLWKRQQVAGVAAAPSRVHTRIYELHHCAYISTINKKK